MRKYLLLAFGGGCSKNLRGKLLAGRSRKGFCKEEYGDYKPFLRHQSIDLPRANSPSQGKKGYRLRGLKIFQLTSCTASLAHMPCITLLSHTSIIL